MNKVSDSLVIGLGNQGKKRVNLIKAGTFKTLDPYVNNSDFKRLSEINLENYKYIYICTPDSEKFKLIKFFIKKNTRILVEKPLMLHSKQFDYIWQNLSKNKSKLYVAYNHRFEPNINKTKKFILNNSLGKIYAIELLYSNGTARLVKNSKWRDKDSGVIPDLLSHLIDTLQFWFPKYEINLNEYKYWRNENLAPDRAIIDLEMTMNRNIIPVRTEVNLISWKNEFRAKIYGEYGNIVLKDFCKWGNSFFEFHERKLPSGVPKVKLYRWNNSDPTWELEYKFFKTISQKYSLENFKKNYENSKILSKIKVK